MGYGGYQTFGIALEEGGRRQDGVGHQLLLDLDFRVTGTERLHVQWRPVGEGNTGGSYYQLSDPAGYVENATGVPDRFWVEGELASVFGSWFSPFAVRDFHVVLGKVPFVLHNQLLINDDVLGIVVNKNTFIHAPLSNVNLQLFAFPDDVDAAEGRSADLYGAHLSSDYRGSFIELSYARLQHGASGRDADYAAASVTKFFGPTSVAGRALFKWGDEGGRGDGRLFVLETSRTRSFHSGVLAAAGVEYGVFYANLFAASEGWNSISGGNFNRLTSTFQVNPLITISRNPTDDDTWGAALGVQLFRHHEDESLIPEVAFEHPGGESVWGLGLRYLRKTGPRTYLEALGVRTFSDSAALRREGVFISHFLIL